MKQDLQFYCSGSKQRSVLTWAAAVNSQIIECCVMCCFPIDRILVKEKFSFSLVWICWLWWQEKEVKSVSGDSGIRDIAVCLELPSCSLLVREFSPHIPGRHFCTSCRKKLQTHPTSPSLLGGSSARFRLHLPDSPAFSSELLSSSGAAIPEQLCPPSVLAFIVFILQRALVSGSGLTAGAVPSLPGELQLDRLRLRAEGPEGFARALAAGTFHCSYPSDVYCC